MKLRPPMFAFYGLLPLLKSVPNTNAKLLAGVIFLAVAKLLILLLLPLLAWQFEASQKGTFIGLWPLLAIAMMTLLLQVTLLQWGNSLAYGAAFQLSDAYRQQLLNRLVGIPMNRIRQQPAGFYAALFSEDVGRLERLFSHVLPELMALVLACVVAWLGLFFISASAAFALLAAVLIGCAMAVLLHQRFKRAATQKLEEQQVLAGQLVEYCHGISSLRLFNQTGPWLQSLRQGFEQLRLSSLGLEAIGGGAILAFRLTVEMSLVYTLWLLLMAELPLLTAAILLLLQCVLLQYLLAAVAFSMEVQGLVQAQKRISEVLPLTATDPSLMLSTKRNRDNLYSEAKSGAPKIECKNLCFFINQRTILRNINLRIEAAGLTAVVGRSGCGKTTLLQLLAGFYASTPGQYFLGGIDTTFMPESKLYGRVALLEQQVQLFYGSILDNLLIAKPDASTSQIQRACELAHCNSFIEKQAQGVDTIIGEDGCQLSGGERQRLALARAILNDTDILLLDELSASVDNHSQDLLIQSLNVLRRTKTIVLVDHRLASVQGADQILLMEQGGIVQQGKHYELLEQPGLYRKLWQCKN